MTIKLSFCRGDTFALYLGTSDYNRRGRVSASVTRPTLKPYRSHALPNCPQKSFVGRNKTMLAQRMVAFPAIRDCLCRKRFPRLRSKSLIPAYNKFKYFLT